MYGSFGSRWGQGEQVVYDGRVINLREEVNIESSAEMDIDEVEIENGCDQIDTGDKVEDDENVHGISDYGDYFSTNNDDGLFELVPVDEYIMNLIL